MASVKKTMKASETKQAKQVGARHPKAKASNRSAESKARKAKAAAARALAARKLAAAKKLAAQKSAQKAKAKVKTIVKTKTAAAASSRSNNSAAATRVVKNKKKAPAATRASAAGAGNVTPRAIKKAAAAARRGKTTLTRGATAKPTAATKPVKAARKGATSKSARGKLADAPKKTPAIKVSRRNAAKPAAAARMAVESKTRATQKPAAGKDAAAALLALRNVARLAEARKRAAAVNPVQHAVNSSNLHESNERMTVIKEAKKKMGTASGLADTTVARPPAKDTAAGEAARVSAKGAGTPLDRKTASKLGPPLIGDRTVALAPVAADAGQLNLAEARPADKQAAPAPKPVRTGSSQRQLFKPGEFVVYPAHGVGQIIAIEEQEVAGFKLELYVISFIKDKMILKVPTPKVASVGMRKLADASAVKGALDTLAGRARVKRTMWSRRAQEYEAKINSGDLNAIAEVVRDLYRSDTQPEQSYSERQLYEAALDRMTREIVVVQKLTETESLKVIEAQLQKGPRRGKTEEIDAEEAEIEEAA
jgi:CarD family transcriptional regulator